jgi:hypothetical protein
VEGQDAKAILAAVRDEVEGGADRVLSEVDGCLAALAAARAGSTEALDQLGEGLCRIMEACAFQDLAGQRLTILACLIDPAAGPARHDPLLNGPALAGGLAQRDADQLLASSPPVERLRSS